MHSLKSNVSERYPNIHPFPQATNCKKLQPFLVLWNVYWKGRNNLFIKALRNKSLWYMGGREGFGKWALSIILAVLQPCPTPHSSGHSLASLAPRCFVHPWVKSPPKSEITIMQECSSSTSEKLWPGRYWQSCLRCKSLNSRPPAQQIHSFENIDLTKNDRMSTKTQHYIDQYIDHTELSYLSLSLMAPRDRLVRQARRDRGEVV